MAEQPEREHGSTARRPFEVGKPAATASKCTLCGLPVGRSLNRMERQGQTLAFCCPGCKAVYQILSSTPGLTPEDFQHSPAFRAARASGLIPGSAEESPSPRDKGPESGLPLARGEGGGDGETAHDFSSPAPGNGFERSPASEETRDAGVGQELTLELRGMWCSACAWLIENMLRKQKGVLSARAHFLSDVARVRYLPHQIHPEQILETVSRLGYEARFLAEDSGGGEGSRSLLIRLGITLILALNTMMISWALYFGFFQDLGNDGVRLLSYPVWLLATPAVFYGGYPILRKAFLGLGHGAVSMETLIATGALSAYGYSTVQMIRGGLHLYFDTAAMLVALVLFGKTIEARARERITGGVKGLYRLTGGKARLVLDDRERWVSLDELRVGDACDVLASERIPVDGVIIAGRGSVDESCLTGESHPKAKRAGDTVLAGTRLLGGSLRIRTARMGRATTLQHMIRIMTESLTLKNPTELLADRVTRWMIPAVLVLASTTGAWVWVNGSSSDEALLRALTVLLITCPCALGIATPLAKVAAVWAARSFGVIIRDPSAIEKLSGTEVFVFDKTGTVTEGRFIPRSVLVLGMTEEEALGLLGALEIHSSHVLAGVILRQCEDAALQIVPADDFRAEAGMGVSGRVGGVRVLGGSPRWMESNGLVIPQSIGSALTASDREGLTPVLLARAGTVCALFAFGDSIRAEAPALLDRLRTQGIRAHLVSGDSLAATERVASRLRFDAYAAEALPQDKVTHIEECRSRGLRVAMLGDGVNDGAALARADVGLACGNAADLLHEAADVTILSGGLESVSRVHDLCRLSTRVIKQNLFAAFFYNLLGIPLAIAGWLNPLMAVLAMLASSLTVIANSLRIKRKMGGDA